MDRHEQLADWERIAALPDCVTADRLCHEDVQAMVARIKANEAVLHRIAEANARGSLVTIVARLCAIIDMVRDVLK